VWQTQLCWPRELYTLSAYEKSDTNNNSNSTSSFRDTSSFASSELLAPPPSYDVHYANSQQQSLLTFSVASEGGLAAVDQPTNE
jgi:hypothetical protein